MLQIYPSDTSYQKIGASTEAFEWRENEKSSDFGVITLHGSFCVRVWLKTNTSRLVQLHVQ
jgi:hypothetical protein